MASAMAEVPLPSSTAFAVMVASPVPPLATGSVPVTSVVRLAGDWSTVWNVAPSWNRGRSRVVS